VSNTTLQKQNHKCLCVSDAEAVVFEMKRRGGEERRGGGEERRRIMMLIPS